MRLPEDGPKYGLKHVTVIKQNQRKQLDWFILKYLLFWRSEYYKLLDRLYRGGRDGLPINHP
jgi:hypothetical protein